MMPAMPLSRTRRHFCRRDFLVLVGDERVPVEQIGGLGIVVPIAGIALFVHIVPHQLGVAGSVIAPFSGKGVQAVILVLYVLPLTGVKGGADDDFVQRHAVAVKHLDVFRRAALGFFVRGHGIGAGMVHGVRVVGIDVVGHQIDVIEIGDRFAQLRYLEIPGFAACRNGQGTVPLQLIQLLPQRFQQQSVPVSFGEVAVYRGVFPVDVQAVKAVSFHGTRPS